MREETAVALLAHEPRPGALLAQATEVATELARVIEGQHLYVIIAGRKYVRCEGWTTCAAMRGVIPREVSNVEDHGLG
jgi:hypothetical protein